MPRPKIFTDEEIKERRYKRMRACHLRRMQNDEEYRKQRVIYQQNYMKKKEEEFKRYKEFYDNANKENIEP